MKTALVHVENHTLSFLTPDGEKPFYITKDPVGHAGEIWEWIARIRGNDKIFFVTFQPLEVGRLLKILPLDITVLDGATLGAVFDLVYPDAQGGGAPDTPEAKLRIVSEMLAFFDQLSEHSPLLRGSPEKVKAA